MSELTKLTVNLTPRARTALGAAAVMAHETETNTVNRALQVYAALLEVGQHEGVYRLNVDVDGRPLYVVACRTEAHVRRRRWWSR